MDGGCLNRTPPRGGPREAVRNFAVVCSRVAELQGLGYTPRKMADILGVSIHCIYRALRRVRGDALKEG